MHDKLVGYSLQTAHEVGGPKGRGFSLILGITAREVGYLEGAIQTGVLLAPVSSVRESPPWGINCVVVLPVRGLGEKDDRVVKVRTVWRIAGPDAPPQMVTAFPRPR